MIRILLVDDHDLFCEGMRAVLARDPDFQVVAKAHSSQEARRAFSEQGCDVAVVDISLPGAGGTALARDLRRESPGLRILMLSMHNYPDVVADAFECGATGYALKSQSPVELFEAIHTVAAGERYLAPTLSSILFESRPNGTPAGLLGQLSKREREVYYLLIRGHSNTEISSHLFISIKTVETHRMHIMKKLNVHSMGDLVRLAARNGHLPT